MSSSRSINEEYYEARLPGRLDYWRKMAAPRFRIATFLHFLKKMPARLNLVDLGCGSGELLKVIRASHPGYDLCGIDLSRPQIEENRDQDSSVDWRIMDLDQTQKCPDELAGRFDVVVASEVIEHVEKPANFLTNAFSLAKSNGGKIFLSTQSGDIWETERRVGHRRHFTFSEMTALLESTGWKPLRVWNAGFPFHDLSKRLANIDPDTTMEKYSRHAYTFSQQLICWALRIAFKFNSNRKGTQLFAVAERP